MDYTYIVNAGDLDRYALTRESQTVIPELVYLLIKQSCPSLSVCRVPYGDAVNQPGRDGVVEAEEGFLEFVPEGKSCWEIGTGANPQDKATKDFRKRTSEIEKKDRSKSSFVFVTPRSSASEGWSEPDQTKWLEGRKESGWKEVRILDGVKLADWLRDYPGVGRWMAKKLGLTLNLVGLSTASEHWADLASHPAPGDPPLSPKLFTVGRGGASEALQALFRGIFEGKAQVLNFFAESRRDVADFVAAFLAGLDAETSRHYGDRCLYIRDEQAWLSVVETRSPHVLVADPSMGLETEDGAHLLTKARRKNHSVIVPLCGMWAGYSPEIIKLRNPSQSQIETVLKESGYTEIHARELGRIGGDRIAALLRHLRGHGSLPPYATWDNASLLAKVGLVGCWDGSNQADRSALELLLGKDYGEWIEVLRPDALRSDSPLIQNNEKWRFVARGEAWNSLGSHITNDDLDRFQKAAIAVLSERDPQFDLLKEDRFAASINGKVLSHSLLIRKGIAETLALLGSRPHALSSCSEGKPETVAILVVRALLNAASWERWAGLNSLMPLLAEAAPDEFLDAVESALVDLDSSPFHRIFAEEGNSGVGGWNYMTGLLWALETLAWSPEYLSRVSVILADLASFDPGGNWVNRPSNSLADIFLPWHVQTAAPFDKRKSAIEAVIKGQSDVGWRLLLALLPNNHGVTTGCHRPVWRDFIPRDWNDGNVLQHEYWREITIFVDLAIGLAKGDLKKLCELIKRLSDLPKFAHESLLEYLNSNAVILLTEAERLPLWEALDELARDHRKYSDASWALPEDAVKKIEETAQRLEPGLPVYKHRQLFNGRDFDLYDEKGNYEEQQKRLDEIRCAAVGEILDGDNIDKVLKFAATVDVPHEVGRALGVIATEKMEALMLPSFLDSEDEVLFRVVAGFIWTRFYKLDIEWVDAILDRQWSPEHQAKFLTLLPFEEEIWRRVSRRLTATHEALYWKHVKVNPYGRDRDLTPAIEKLLEYGREGAAVMCVARTVDDKDRFNESLATRALLAVLESEQGVKELDRYHTIELIGHLQKSETSDKAALFRIEWNFLPWLDRFSSGSPVTLEKRLASDPSFFAEVVRLVFRSRKTKEDEISQPDEAKKRLATNAFKLLREWRHCPGKLDDGSFSGDALNAWIEEVRKLTEESGHSEVAQIQIGHVLTRAPADPCGLWIHEAVAAILNSRDTGQMRSGFTTQLFNDRGVFTFTHGKEERELARENREKADALETKGYTRFATAMREFAEQYDRQAEREEKRDPYED